MVDLDKHRNKSKELKPRRPLESRLEKFLAMHIYLLRRGVHVFCKANFVLCGKLLTGLGFKFEYTLEDHDQWAWFSDWKFPRYVLERKD